MNNQTINNAIKKYNNNKEDTSFDVKVIKILVIIYGQDILNISNFKENILKYGLDENQLLLFEDELTNYLNTNNMSSFLTVYKILIDMIVLKYKDSYITNEEVSVYEQLFYEGKSINFLNNYWNEALYKINKNYNDKNSDLYNPYNNYLQRKNIDDIKALNNEKLTDFSKKRIEKYNKDTFNDDKELTTGNGFIDIIMMLAFICTQVMLGFIALGHFIRR